MSAEISQKCPACGERLVEVDISVGYGFALFCGNEDCNVISVKRKEVSEDE